MLPPKYEIKMAVRKTDVSHFTQLIKSPAGCSLLLDAIVRVQGSEEVVI